MWLSESLIIVQHIIINIIIMHFYNVPNIFCRCLPYFGNVIPLASPGDVVSSMHCVCNMTIQYGVYCSGIELPISLVPSWNLCLVG